MSLKDKKGKEHSYAEIAKWIHNNHLEWQDDPYSVRGRAQQHFDNIIIHIEDWYQIINELRKLQNKQEIKEEKLEEHLEKNVGTYYHNATFIDDIYKTWALNEIEKVDPELADNIRTYLKTSLLTRTLTPHVLETQYKLWEEEQPQIRGPLIVSTNMTVTHMNTLKSFIIDTYYILYGANSNGYIYKDEVEQTEVGEQILTYMNNAKRWYATEELADAGWKEWMFNGMQDPPLIPQELDPDLVNEGVIDEIDEKDLDNFVDDQKEDTIQPPPPRPEEPQPSVQKKKEIPEEFERRTDGLYTIFKTTWRFNMTLTEAIQNLKRRALATGVSEGLSIFQIEVPVNLHPRIHISLLENQEVRVYDPKERSKYSKYTIMRLDNEREWIQFIRRVRAILFNETYVEIEVEFSDNSLRTFPLERWLLSFEIATTFDDCSVSDRIIFNEILLSGNFTIKIYPNNRGRRSRGGRFWRYLNKSKLNLEKLGIFKDLDREFKDTCFINSLKELGFENEKKLDEVRVIINRGRVTNRDCSKIASMLDINLTVWSENKILDRENRSRKYKKYTWNEGMSLYDDSENSFSENSDIIESKSEYALVETEEHYMPLIKFNEISKDWLNNYDSWKEEPTDTVKVNGVKKTGLDLSKVEKIVQKIDKTTKHKYRIKQIMDCRADTKDIIYFLFQHDELQEKIQAVDYDNVINYLNDDFYFQELQNPKEHQCRRVNRSGTKFYYQKLKNLKNGLKYSNKIQYIIDKTKKNVILDEYLQPFCYPGGLTDKYRILFDQKNKFQSSTILRREFIKNIKNKKQKYTTIPAYKNCSKEEEKEVVPIRLKEDISVEQYRTLYLDLECGFDKEGYHIPYCICYVDDKNNIGRFKGKNCIRECLDSLKGRYRVYCHNVKYELQFIMKYLERCGNWNNFRLLMGDSNIYNVVGYYYNEEESFWTELFFKDSYKLISEALSKFGSMFNLPVSKDICPYGLYTTDTIWTETAKISEALKHIDPKNHADFIKNIDKVNCRVDKDTFRHVDYSVEYCVKDCQVTKAGVEKFREWIYEITLLDVHDNLTIASIAHRFMIDKGVYEGCFELSNVARYFIQKSVVGGRVMLRDNEKQWVRGKIQDFDAVSLYPSAMKRLGDIGGFLKGTPKVLKPNQLNMDFLNTCDGYFVEIFIKKCNKPLHMGLYSVKTENDENCRIFGNQENVSIVVDRITLEDLIRWQDIEFEIIKGYYFKEGRNNFIKNVIELLFNERKKYKELGNPIQLIFKLLMNSSYGKTIQKARDSQCILIPNKKLTDYKIKNWYNIKQTTTIHEGEYTIVDCFSSINEHFSLPQIGSEILSMSKRIMNEVICLAESLNIPIYYQDTDSIHIDEKNIEYLSVEYNKKYNRELIGKNLGQFHSDFSSEKGKVQYSSEFIGLGKKCYIDKLFIDNNTIDWHIRMKGVSLSCILQEAEDQKCTPLDLYHRLYDGETIAFDLCKKGIRFQFDKCFNVRSASSFVREINF